jgi:UDP-N-acetylglucosamine 2-epimerase (non-hydrolysing)
MRRTILSVVGTRPNFMKTAPVVAELQRRHSFESVLVHTGQHYDEMMSGIFLDELGVGQPDFMLNVGAGSHGQTVARVMEALEPVLLEVRPDLVLVPGDVNSTMGAALTAAKLVIPVGHIEAGLRSFDRTMPEEINRIVTDSISQILFVHSPEAVTNLLREGHPPEAIREVGNTMIDTLVVLRGRLDGDGMRERLGIERGSYLLVTLHRPALVDGPLLVEAMKQLGAIAAEMPVVFPAHPRTRARLRSLGLEDGGHDVKIIDPLGYLEFMGLVEGAGAVLTDSGGIQEETTVLGVPCFTLRDNTERPVTVEQGTNVLLGLAPGRIAEVPALAAAALERGGSVPPGWDGRAAPRVVDFLEGWFEGRGDGLTDGHDNGTEANGAAAGAEGESQAEPIVGPSSEHSRPGPTEA